MGRTSDAKERLLGSAGALIHEKGYHAVGVGEICAHAGVQKGSFYYFFPSKQQLALEVVEHHWQAAREQLEAHLLGDDLPLVRLRRFLDAAYTFHEEQFEACGQQKGCPLANLALEMSGQDRLLRERLRQAFDGHLGYFEGVLREAVTRGDAPPELDVPRAAQGLVALIEGSIMLSKVRGDTAPLKVLPQLVSAQIGVDLPAA